MGREKFEIIDGVNIKINGNLGDNYKKFEKLAKSNGGEYSKGFKVFVFQDERGAKATKEAAEKDAVLMADFKNAELIDGTIKINSMTTAQFTYLVKTAERNGGTYDKEKKSIFFHNAEDAVKTFGSVFKEEAATPTQKQEPRKQEKAKVGFEQDGTKVSANGFLQKYEFAIYATIATKNGGKYDGELKALVFEDLRGANEFMKEAQKDFAELSDTYGMKKQPEQAAQETTTDVAEKSQQNVRRNR